MGREKAALHTEDVSKLKWIRGHSRKHSPGFWTVNNRAVKNSHISPLWSSSWLWVSQQLQHSTTAWRPVGRCSRAKQTNYTPVKTAAQHCIIPTETPLSHCTALLRLSRPRTDEPWGPGMCGTAISPTIKCWFSFIKEAVLLKQRPAPVSTHWIAEACDSCLIAVSVKAAGLGCFHPVTLPWSWGSLQDCCCCARVFTHSSQGGNTAHLHHMLTCLWTQRHTPALLRAATRWSKNNPSVSPSASQGHSTLFWHPFEVKIQD